MIKNIAIFASGNGSNAEEIIKHINNYKDKFKVNLIVSNNEKAFVIERAKNNNINFEIIKKSDFTKKESVLNLLSNYKVDFIVLAGFLLLIPEYLVQAYQNKIINIHPALLPKYGGKGMYGMNVHEAVIENNEKESGITIHYVNKNYDDGDIIFQAKCEVENNDTPENLAKKIHTLEHKYFPQVITDLLMKNIK